MEFKAGDIVELKSGSPKMTVNSILEKDFMGSTKGDINCTWYDETTKKVVSKTFKPVILKLSE